MKMIYIRSNNIKDIFGQLQQDLGGELNTYSQEYNLEYRLAVDNDLLSGEITGVCFKNHICFMQYDVVFKEDTILINNIPVSNPIHFMYCAKGTINHSFGIAGQKKALNQFQTGIFSSFPNNDTVLFFERDVEVRLSNIMVTGQCEALTDNNTEHLHDRLFKTFMPRNGAKTFAYTGSYNLKIAEQVQQLETITQKGLVRSFLIQGVINLILAMEIQQHKEDQNNAKNNFGSLTKDEMDDIKELSEFIKNYPEIQYNLKYLSSKSGLSPAKLQEGFKLLHNRTVTDYIRNIRVEAAEQMIKTSNLNISEIVYSVGLTSRSYFSKIFKERFDCSPKFYQDHQNVLVATA